MNRIEFLRWGPLAAIGLFVGKGPKTEKVIEHIHVNGDNTTISHNVIQGSPEQPAIKITTPVKLFDARGRRIFVGGAV